MVDLIKRLWGTYSELALPIRLLIAGIVSAFGGSGVIGFLSEYASYAYAIYFGFRPPLEGIPFLRVAVTIMTILVYVGGALIFLALLGVARLVIWYTYRLARQILGWLQVVLLLMRGFRAIVLFLKQTPSWRRLRVIRRFLRRYKLKLPEPEALVATYIAPKSPREISLYATIIGTTLGVLMGLALFFDKGMGVGLSILFAVGLAIFMATVVVLIWRLYFITLVALIGTLVFFLIAPFALFHAPSYARILRVLGYGGGIEVNISLLSDQGKLVPAYNAFLILRTTNSLLLYKPDSEVVAEISLINIGSFEHTAGLLSRTKWRMPPFTLLNAETDKHKAK